MFKERIGFYGGTFDPPHFGHLNLALELLEAHGLDEVWFSPAAASPNKLDQEITAPMHRLAMCELAVQGFSHFRVLREEIDRGGTSYTVEAMRALVAKHKGIQFFLIMSDETVAGFASWQAPEELLRLCPPLVGRRLSRGEPFPSSGHAQLDRLLRKGFTDTAVMEIHATAVRERLRKGLPCGHLVPERVLSYLRQKAIHF